MRRSASEVIRNLEMRVARLERQSSLGTLKGDLDLLYPKNNWPRSDIEFETIKTVKEFNFLIKEVGKVIINLKANQIANPDPHYLSLVLDEKEGMLPLLVEEVEKRKDFRAILRDIHGDGFKMKKFTGSNLRLEKNRIVFTYNLEGWDEDEDDLD